MRAVAIVLGVMVWLMLPAAAAPPPADAPAEPPKKNFIILNKPK